MLVGWGLRMSGLGERSRCWCKTRMESERCKQDVCVDGVENRLGNGTEPASGIG